MRRSIPKFIVGLIEDRSKASVANVCAAEVDRDEFIHEFLLWKV
jgi:hypothetical protein